MKKNYLFQGSKEKYDVAEKNSLWFAANSEVDIAIQAQFSDLVALAQNNALDSWLNFTWSRLALIILLDQFTRNIHRGTPSAFISDEQAREICKQGLELKLDLTLSPIGRLFFYLPLEHSENYQDQQQCVALFKQLLRDVAVEYKAIFFWLSGLRNPTPTDY